MQFLNPTFLVGAVRAGRAGAALRPDATHPSALEHVVDDLVDGHTDRLIPVTQIDLGDIEWSHRRDDADARGRAAGRSCSPRRRWAAEADADGGETLARSITHPDFEPIWDAAEDLGMAAFAHVGFARERINPGWANNGADDLQHVQRC